MIASAKEPTSDVAQLKSFIKICNKNSTTELTHEAEQNSASNPIAVNLTRMRKGLCLQSKQAMDTGMKNKAGAPLFKSVIMVH